MKISTGEKIVYRFRKLTVGRAIIDFLCCYILIGIYMFFADARNTLTITDKAVYLKGKRIPLADIVSSRVDGCKLALSARDGSNYLSGNLKNPAEAQKCIIQSNSSSEEVQSLVADIEAGNLPELEPDINLTKAERLHFREPATWYEERVQTTRVNYGGLNYRIKIAKGLSYRIGTIKPERIRATELQPIDEGLLYLTNKRLVFVAEHGTKTIQLSKILSFTPYIDGVAIHKDAGRSPTIQFNTASADIFCAILSHVMNNEG